MEQEIKIVARATAKRGKESFGIVELKIPGKTAHKVVSAEELKGKAGVKMISQTKKDSVIFKQ